MPAIDNKSAIKLASESILVVAKHKVDGKTIGHVVADGQSILIGSDDQCRLRLQDASVSPKHCLIRVQDGEVWLQDWCSRNGTHVNDQSIDGMATVAPGDRIEVGDFQLTVTSHAIGQARDLPENDCIGAATCDAESEETTTTRDAAAQNNTGQNTMSLAPASRPPQPITGRPSARLSGATSVENDTIELLKSEIELLQSELSDKDAQLAQMAAEPNADCDESSPAVVAELEQRIERLLFELDQSDQRISALEEVSRLVEETSLAEAEEKRQLEAWVHDIETRIGDREAESRAECEVLQKRLQQAVEEQDRLQDQIARLLDGSGGDPALEQIIQVLRKDNESLRGKVGQRDTAVGQLQQKCAELERQSSEDYIQQRIDDALRSERLLLAQERAALSRRQLELTNKVHELKREMERQDRVHPADDRFHAFRARLKELHEQEKTEYVPPTITQRLVRLWQRLDGPTDQD